MGWRASSPRLTPLARGPAAICWVELVAWHRAHAARAKGRCWDDRCVKEHGDPLESYLKADPALDPLCPARLSGPRPPYRVPGALTGHKIAIFADRMVTLAKLKYLQPSGKLL